MKRIWARGFRGCLKYVHNPGIALSASVSEAAPPFGDDVAELREKAGKGRAVVFPPFGTTEQQGHGGFARRADAAAVWGPTVLAFFGDAMGK